MICLNMDGRNFESDAGIIREQEVRIMQNGKTKGILLHGFITKEEISIIMNTGLIMDSHGEGKLGRNEDAGQIRRRDVYGSDRGM